MFTPTQPLLAKLVGKSQCPYVRPYVLHLNLILLRPLIGPQIVAGSTRQQTLISHDQIPASHWSSPLGVNIKKKKKKLLF